MGDCSVLIIGGDSLIGTQLGLALNTSGIRTWRTSRRQFNQEADTYFLDLEDLVSESIQLPKASVVIFCAGITDYATCSKNIAISAQINVVNTVKLASNFLRQNCHVIFLSSAAAIGNEIAPNENVACSPLSAYGVLKRATELGLECEAEKYNASLSIVRLTKVISRNTPFINKWLTDSMKGLPIKAYSNSYLSPITIDYVCEAILKLIFNKSRGIFHLSGEKVITYVDLAQLMEKIHLLPSPCIDKVKINEGDGKKGFFDATLLAMTETTKNLGIKPEPLVNVLQYLKIQH